MNLNDIHRGVKKNRPRKRLGRGIGSGHGKTAGRGHKGQWGRNGVSFLSIFQGGTMPLVRRIPKRGFNNRWAKTVLTINLGDFNELAMIDPSDVHIVVEVHGTRRFRPYLRKLKAGLGKNQGLGGNGNIQFLENGTEVSMVLVEVQNNFVGLNFLGQHRGRICRVFLKKSVSCRRYKERENA